MTTPADSTPKIPVFQETIAGSLIDSARISVIAALSMMPRIAPLILLPGEEEDDPINTPQGCLEQAMEWLDAARVHTIEQGAPVTSIHQVGRAP